MIAFDQVEPGCFRSRYHFQFLESCLHQGRMILGARDSKRQLIEHGQLAHAHSRVVQDHQKKTCAEEHLRKKVRLGRNAASLWKPREIQSYEAGGEQKRPKPDTSEAITDKLEGSHRGNQTAGYFEDEADGSCIRKI